MLDVVQVYSYTQTYMQVYEAGERCKTKETADRGPQNQTEASKGYSVRGTRKNGIL